MKLRGKNSFFLLLLLLASCASAPKISFSGGDERGNALSVLPSGASAYLWVDAVKGRPLLDVLSFEGISGKDVSDILDRTNSAAAAIFPSGDGRRFFLAALGDYPRVGANFSLTFSKGWKKQKSASGSSYWYSQKDKVALALGSNLALVSDTDPLENFRAEAVPQGFTDFSRTTVLSGWLSNPSESINSFLSTTGIPIQVPAEDFFFGAQRIQSATEKPDTEPWQLVFRIRTASAAQARSLLSLFTLARFFIMQAPAGSESESSMDPMEAAALLLANTPEQNGDAIILFTNPLDEDSIALLFNMFSIYSK